MKIDKSNKKDSVPVFMYHSIGIIDFSWDRNQLTCPFEVFEEQLKFLKRRNYKTVHLNDLYASINQERQLPGKTVILTFDDGYADNYVFAYPLLKKYGFKGTIFVNPDFIDPSPVKRHRIDRINSLTGIKADGFLSWEEMREMESIGVIDIQSHAMTHTWYPFSSEIVDFRHPGDDYKWMTWNSYAEKKPFLQTDDKSLVNLGQPVYKFEKSLMIRRYFPDRKLDAFIINYVSDHGGNEFFNNPEWKSLLFSKVTEYKHFHSIDDSYETMTDWQNRLRNELIESKTIIEKHLNKKVHFLCWPGGSGTKEGIALAKEVGFKMTTVARDLSPQERKRIKNDGLIYSDRIARTSPILYTGKSKNGYAKPVYCDSFGMWLRIVAFKNAGLVHKLLNGIIYLYGKMRYNKSVLSIWFQLF